MTRHFVSLAAVVCLSGSQAFAQDIVMTVGSAAADVYKAPTTASPIVGHAPPGLVIDITRELGSWVKVAWPGAPDGVGYVHVSKGTVGPRKAAEAPRMASAAPAPAPASTAPVAAAPVRTEQTAAVNRTTLARPVYVTPAMHTVGLGATMGGTSMGFGASARAWSKKRFGAQIDFSHYAMDDALSTQHATSLQFEPSVLFSMKDTVSDYVWLRPYVGSGINIAQQTLTTPNTVGASTSETNLGGQIFGGTELTFPGMPQLALSAQASYHWIPTPTTFTGMDFSGFGVSVAAHWYFK
jgi:hypothetical protein